MHNRRWLWLGILLLVIVVVVVPTIYHHYDNNPIRYENFDKIKDDMTEKDIEDLLGVPPGDYRSGHVEYEFMEIDFPAFTHEAKWLGNRGDIIIYRDAEQRIIGKIRIPGEREPVFAGWMHALWDRLRWR